MAEDPSAEKNPDNDYDMVFIWDLEYITMLDNFATICVKLYRNFPLHIINPLLDLVDKVSYSVGLSPVVSDYRLDNIQDVVRNEDDDSIDIEKTIEEFPKYDALRQMYNEISDKLRNYRLEWQYIVSRELIEKCGKLDKIHEIYKAALVFQNLFHEGWRHARRCMKLVNKRSNKSGKKFANVVICCDGIARAAAELLVAGLSSEVPIENIYLTNIECLENSTFTRVQKRFGEQCTLITVTSCPDLSSGAKKLNIPVWPAGKVDSLRNLYKVQRDFLLRDKADFISALFNFSNA